MNYLKLLLLFPLFFIPACYTAPQNSKLSTVKRGTKLVTIQPTYLSVPLSRADYAYGPRFSPSHGMRSLHLSPPPASSAGVPRPNRTMIPPGAEILVSNRFRTSINPFKFSKFGNASEDYVRGIFVGGKYPEFTEEILRLEDLFPPDFLRKPDAAEVVQKFRAEKTADENRRDDIARAKRMERYRLEAETEAKARAEWRKAYPHLLPPP